MIRQNGLPLVRSEIPLSSEQAGTAAVRKNVLVAFFAGREKSPV